MYHDACEEGKRIESTLYPFFDYIKSPAALIFKRQVFPG